LRKVKGMSVDLLKTATKRVVGVKQTMRSLQKGTAESVFIAEDADARITDPVVSACAAAGILCERVTTMQELGKACGIRAGASAAAILRE